MLSATASLGYWVFRSVGFRPDFGSDNTPYTACLDHNTTTRFWATAITIITMLCLQQLILNQFNWLWGTTLLKAELAPYCYSTLLDLLIEPVLNWACTLLLRPSWPLNWACLENTNDHDYSDLRTIKLAPYCCPQIKSTRLDHYYRLWGTTLVDTELISCEERHWLILSFGGIGLFQWFGYCSYYFMDLDAGGQLF